MRMLRFGVGLPTLLLYFDGEFMGELLGLSQRDIQRLPLVLGYLSGIWCCIRVFRSECC